MKENRKYNATVAGAVSDQYMDLCKDNEPSYQIINGVYFILVPEERIYKRQLKKLSK